jgi:hypothetical protein
MNDDLASGLASCEVIDLSKLPLESFPIRAMALV